MARNRKIGSIKNELATKAREAMLSAVQVYNNPNIHFKAETFVVLAIIAWTYLMHAYYKKQNIEYCYFSKTKGGRKKYDKTKHGAKKHWELERCIDCADSPLDVEVAQNLRFLIGLRHEIEHQMTTRIDDTLSAKFQACCVNFNDNIIKLIGNKYAIDKHLSFSLQFASISEPHVEQLSGYKDLPKHVQSFITSFDDKLDDAIFNSPQYSYRVLFVQKNVNRKGQADKVIEFLPADSPLATELNKEYYVIKDREKQKYLPGQIVNMLKAKGYVKLNMHHFVQCWKKMNARKDNTYGCKFGGKEWYWYANFIPVVEEYCKENNLDK